MLIGMHQVLVLVPWTKLALRVSHVSDCMTYDLVTSITVITQLGMFITIYVTKLANSLQLHSLVENKQGSSCKPISLSIMGYGSLYNYIIHAALIATMHISLLAISFGSIQKCTNVQSIYMWYFKVWYSAMVSYVRQKFSWYTWQLGHAEYSKKHRTDNLGCLLAMNNWGTCIPQQNHVYFTTSLL